MTRTGEAQSVKAQRHTETTRAVLQGDAPTADGPTYEVRAIDAGGRVKLKDTVAVLGCVAGATLMVTATGPGTARAVPHTDGNAAVEARLRLHVPKAVLSARGAGRGDRVLLVAHERELLVVCLSVVGELLAEAWNTQHSASPPRPK